MSGVGKFLAVLGARNLEFVRDRGTMAWNLIFPFLILVGFLFIFGRDADLFTVSVLAPESEWSSPIFEVDEVRFLESDEREDLLAKVGRHQVDMVLEPATPEGNRYWINSSNARGTLLESLLLATDPQGDWQIGIVEGREIRYVDWALPGVLGMNIMFSCLIGVGFVIVRYRKNGVLRRLKVTPLSAFEFLCAQVVSRILLVLFTTLVVYAGSILLLGLRVEGSHLAAFTVFAIGAFALISLGLVFASRTASEELAGGLLNFATWPMMLLSGIFFPLEGAPAWLTKFADLLPLTQMTRAARQIMTEGATLVDVAPDLLGLLVMSALGLAIGSLAFRWE